MKPMSAEVERQLYDLYYVKKMLFGRDKLWKYAVSQGIKVSRRAVMEWLREQMIHQLYQNSNKTKNITRTVLNKPHSQIAIDLIDMSNNEFNKKKYILTAYDLFSKKAYARALPNKTGKVVSNSMQDILKKDMKEKPSSIRSDNGSEFIGVEFKKLLQKNKIKQVLSLPSKPQSNGGIERLNKTIKALLRKTMKLEQSNDWPKYLPQIIKGYNSVPHAITKQVPDELDKGNADNVNNAYSKIKKNAMNKRQSTKIILNVGDKVRIKLEEEDPVKFNTGEIWSKKLYKIVKITKPRSIMRSPTFQIADGNKILSKIFYVNDLLYIPRVRNAIDEPQKYEVLRLVRPLYHNKVPSYEVRWKHYTSADNTIEPRSTLLKEIPKTVRAYEKKYNVVFGKNSIVTYDEE